MDASQLKRVPGSLPLCGPEWAEELAWEIMTSLKEHLQQRQWSHHARRRTRMGAPPEAYMPHHPAKAPQKTQQRDDDSCDWASLAEARETHWSANGSCPPT